MLLSIILPVYNEEDNLPQLLSGIKNILNEQREIIVVDDGSTDNSAKLAKENGALVIRHPYKIGNGAAIKSGIREAKGGVLILMDADGQHNPADIRNLLGFIDSYDMVVGARTKNSHASISRRLLNRIYNCLASYVTSIRIEDLTSGFRVIKRDLALKFLYLLPNGFSYPTTLTLALLRSGRSIKYVPVNALKRKGKSKIKPLVDGANFFLIIAKITTLFSPFKIFLPISGLFFTLGIGYYAYTYVAFHRFTNMSALLITTGLIIFMLGLISEQIAQLRLDRTEAK